MRTGGKKQKTNLSPLKYCSLPWAIHLALRQEDVSPSMTGLHLPFWCSLHGRGVCCHASSVCSSAEDFSLFLAWASTAAWKRSHSMYQMARQLTDCSLILGVLCSRTDIRKTLCLFNHGWHIELLPQTSVLPKT